LAGDLAGCANQGFVPIVSGTRGFVAYCIINGGEGMVASASVCEDRRAPTSPRGAPRSGWRATLPSSPSAARRLSPTKEPP
jgi:hypothetical protein